MADADHQSTSTKTSLVMKVDGPSDEDVKPDNGEDTNTNDPNTIQPSQICSPALARPVLSSPRLTSVNTSHTNPTNGVLRRSQLSSSSNNSRGHFSLNPSRLNPFLKSFPNGATHDGDNKDENAHVNGETPKFVPLVCTEKSSSTTVTNPTSHVPAMRLSEANNFVFGQNIQDRVIADNKADELKPSTSVNTNGTTDMLFSSAIGKTEVASVRGREPKSLSESAREYEESRAVKRKYDEVEVKTGEEEETNILQITCKLFAFDKTAGSWQERGRGNLRLNDYEVSDHGDVCTKSRLVFRTSGSLRVILNTKIWSEMTIQEASKKSIRFTALDSNGEIKVFLVMANKDEIKQLFDQLDSRVKNEIDRLKHRATEDNKKKKTVEDN